MRASLKARNLQSRSKRLGQEVVYPPFHGNLSIFSKVSKNPPTHVNQMKLAKTSQTAILSTALIAHSLSSHFPLSVFVEIHKSNAFAITQVE